MQKGLYCGLILSLFGGSNYSLIYILSSLFLLLFYWLLLFFDIVFIFSYSIVMLFYSTLVHSGSV